jgi:hypothetical protein
VRKEKNEEMEKKLVFPMVSLSDLSFAKRGVKGSEA